MLIYVVEDQAELRRFLEVLLAKHVVRGFGTGGGAMDALRAVTPDVLLSDLDLPDLPGESLARVALGRPGTRVVLMSANHRRLEQARPFAHALVRKPFSIEELTSVLQDPPSAA